MMSLKVPSYDQYVDTAKANVDAMLTAGTTMTNGMQAMSNLWFGMVTQAFEQTAAAGKAMMDVRSLPQMLDVQSDYARNVYDMALADSAKMSDLSMKVANEAAAPLNDRAKAAWKTVTETVAA